MELKIASGIVIFALVLTVFMADVPHTKYEHTIRAIQQCGEY